MYHPNPIDRIKAIRLAQKWREENPLFLDTETTGLTDMHEICEIAIVDLAGEVLINSLVKPTRPIDANTSAIHGITDEMVQTAPTFGDLLTSLDGILRDRTVLVYNVDFDEGKLARSASANGCELTSLDGHPWWWAYEVKPRIHQSNWHCAMELYATFFGDWNYHHGNYRWQRLDAAAFQCGVDLPTGIHRAHADAELTRRIFLHMAEAEIEKDVTQQDLSNEEMKDEH